ncbi:MULTISPECIES: bacterioferritin-associated ferredoxin [Aliagarivorans]|uniref:bacterioferritin-associated ferredoxin n=1 Tax=Aliagarivorans TaxID=882379 RepID=UPI000414FBC0|nr:MULTISPECIES: bacterioferritin-associated ferredoxin [Aliagarivorans]
MYVCLCKAITDKQIREAVMEGHDTLTKVREKLGVASGCGKCARTAQQVINQELQNQPSYYEVA